MLTLAVCGPAVSGAEPKTYQVEMLIFTNEDGSMAGGGAPARPLIEAQEAIELKNPVDGGDFQRLPDTELTLATAKSILEQSGRYEIIEHVAWRQPGVSEAAARPIHIHGGADYQYSPIAAPAPLPGQAYGSDSLYGATGPTTLQQLDGTVAVTLNYYLQVRTDLMLREPATSTIGIGQQPQSVNGLYQYRIRQSRRMRSGELHYFDHPLLGILVIITPIDRELAHQRPSEPAREQRPDGEEPEGRG